MKINRTVPIIHTKLTLEPVLQRSNVCGSNYSSCTGNWKLTDIVKELVSEQYK
jgi:hypothetical protein